MATIVLKKRRLTYLPVCGQNRLPEKRGLTTLSPIHISPNTDAFLQWTERSVPFFRSAAFFRSSTLFSQYHL